MSRPRGSGAERATGVDAVSAVVVAGGHSRRLGQDKAALCTADGTPLLRLITTRLAEVASEVIIAAGSAEHLARLQALHAWSRDSETRWCIDVPTFGDRGPLGGLYAGLEEARGDAVVAVGCDMPYLNPAALGRLLDYFAGRDMVVPLAEGRAQPLHALYRRATCLPVIARHLREGRLALRDLRTAGELAVELVDLPDGPAAPASWQSVNTPAAMLAAGLRPMADDAQTGGGVR